jgi:serine/threonine protein kinase
MFKRFLRSCFAGEPSSERYAEKMIVGGGSFSTVVVANDTLMGEKVVLKKAKNNAQKREIAAEYALLRSLDHPNIVKPKDYDSEGMGFMVLPFYMQDVYDRIAKKRPSDAEMKMFVKKITSAMDYLHSQDIVHRDIKPDNILMNNDYSSVVLTDFGMAADVATTPTNICGTLAYVSPEAQQAACLRDFTGNIDWKKSDVFSLGVTFYTVFEFDFLFYMRKDDESITPSQKYIDHRIDKSKCSDELKDLLKKMICVDPKERISMADVANHPYLTDK